LPGNPRLEWGLEIVDYQPRKYDDASKKGGNRSSERALISLRDLRDDIYGFTLKQRGGLSRGTIKIDICGRDKNCVNSYSIEWFESPKPYDDWRKMVIAEIKPMESDKPVKQIILYLADITPYLPDSSDGKRKNRKP
jgi:hypothetical protein